MKYCSVSPMKNLIFALAFLLATDASATVLSSTRTTGAVTGTGGTTFAVAFPYIDQSHLVVTRTLVASPYTAVVLTLGSTATIGYYTVSPTSLASSGTVTIGAAISSAYTITVTRVVPVTQPTSYRTQGSYLPKTHEASFDRLTMMIQDVLAGAVTAGDFTAALASHVAADEHTMYLKLAGRAAGQTAYGGTGLDDDLTLRANDKGAASTGVVTIEGMTLASAAGAAGGDATLDGDFDLASGHILTAPSAVVAALYGGTGATSDIVIEGSSIANASKTGSHIYAGVNTAGSVLLTLDEFNSRVGVMNASPTKVLDITGDMGITGTIYGTTGAGGDLLLASTSTAGKNNKGTIFFGTGSGFLEAYDRLGIGNTSPQQALDVTGGGAFSGAVSLLRGVQSKAAAYTVSAPTDCGDIIFVTANALITLPDAATANTGCPVSIVNNAGAGTITLQVGVTDPPGDDHIYGSCGAVELGAAKGHPAVNTLVTSKRGDGLTVASDGSANWFVLSCVGVWAVP